MNQYSLVILVLSFAIAAISVWENDWNWLIIAVIGIAVICAPMRATGNRNAGYDKRLMVIAIAPLVAFIVMLAANPSFNFKYYYPTSLAIQALATMTFGVMIAVFLNSRKEASLSRRWTILFALTFACSLSVLFTFFIVFWMSSAGYPLYNGDFDFNNTLENNDANMTLMLPMAVTTFVTIVYGVILNQYLKRIDWSELSKFRAGGSS